MLNKLRCELAMQQALQEWQVKPQIYGMECPKCKSNQIWRCGISEGVQRYQCKNCQRRFQNRLQLVCDCLIPGKQVKCQDCPQFKEFLEIVKQKVDTLIDLSEIDLEKLESEA